MWQLAKADYWKLLPILGLAFYIAFIPHVNYSYPVHIDEWVHMAHANAIMGAASTTYTDPFSGQISYSLASNLEAGFQMFWGVFQRISGISWLVIFRYFPGVIFMITVLSVYVLARREGFGWEAAFFTCLVPTTIGILGPAFMVPVAMGLLFTPLILFLALNFRTVWSYLAIFIFVSFLLSIHAPSAICPIIVLIPYILLNLKGSFKHSLAITLAVAVPFLAPFPWIFKMLLPTAKSLLTPTPLVGYVDFPQVIQTYGYLPMAFCLLGAFLLAIRGGKKNYGLILGFLALLLMLVMRFTFKYGLHIMYVRGLMYMMLTASIFAGAGLAGLRKLDLSGMVGVRLKNPLVTQVTGLLLCLVVIGVTLAMAIPDRQSSPYHHYIDQKDYEAFIWVRDNVNEGYEKAVVDPWKGTAFTAITHKNIYTRIHAYSQPSDEEAYEFLRGGSTDTAFLEENGISIIYTRVYEWGQDANVEYGSSNPDLEEQEMKDVYLLKEAGD